jgi:serine protease Do
MTDEPTEVLVESSPPIADTHSDLPESDKPEVRRRSVPFVAMIAALVGALIGGGLVALATRDRDGTTINFGRNLTVRDGALDVQGILAKALPAVVSIRTDGFVQQDGFFGPTVQRVRGAGTGMVLSANGDVLTNSHVVEGAQRITVTFEGDDEARLADLVGADPSRDVAIIRIRNASNLKTVTLGRSSELAVGDDVLAIGNALALSGGNTVTRGIVSALDRSVTNATESLRNLIQTDAAINSGNSGGPLVNAAGEVIGMNTIVIRGSATGAPAESIGFAIAIDSIKPLIERLRAGRPAPGTPFIGVSSTDLNPQLKADLEVPVDEGAVVCDVVAGSPAEQAGLQIGDVIVEFGGEKVADAAELVSLVQDEEPDAKVQVVYYRGDDRRTASLTVGSRGVRQ